MEKPSESSKFDALDLKILGLLQENARLANREIATRVGSTEPTVRRRVKRLLESGLVKIVAVATPFDLGYQVVALFGIQIDQSRLPEIANALVSNSEVRFAGVTTGNFDIVAEVWFQTTDELVTFISNRLKRISGVQRVESMQVLKLLKYAYDWGVQPSTRLLPISARSAARSRVPPER